MDLDVAVVGAGQAGLLALYQLRQQLPDKSVRVFERAARVADAWASRWSSLRLFSPALFSQLPGIGLIQPGGGAAEEGSTPDPDYLASKDDVAAYIARFVEHHDLGPFLALQHDVARVSRGEEAHDSAKYVLTVRRADVQSEEGWVEEQVRARCVVLATGTQAVPKLPSWTGDLPSTTHVLNTATYTGPECVDAAAGNVMVVGAGASGVQIAEDIASGCSGCKVWLVGPKLSSMPRRVLGKDLYWWLDLTGSLTIQRSSLIGGMIYKSAIRSGDELVGDMMPRAMAAGVVYIASRVLGADAVAGTFAIDRPGKHPPSNIGTIVFATGFTHPFATLLDRTLAGHVLDDAGLPRQVRGAMSDAAPGLFCLGLPWLINSGSGLLYGQPEDAKAVIKGVAAFFASS